MAIPPLVFALDYRVKNENSFIRSVNLANKSQEQASVSAEKASIAQQKLEARLASVQLRYTNLTERQQDLTTSINAHTRVLPALETEYSSLEQKIQTYTAAIQQASKYQNVSQVEWSQTVQSLAAAKARYAEISPQVTKHRQAIAAENKELQYVNVQLQQRTARVRELEYQLKELAPVEKKQEGFMASMRTSLAKTFSSWENLVGSIERFSVTADRLTRSGQRTINIINKISGAITGKPLLDWDKSAQKATTSNNSFTTSVDKSDKGIHRLTSSVKNALNPIKSLSLVSVAAGTALGNLAAFAIFQVTMSLRQMGFMAVMAAQNIARSAISNVSNFERTSKSLTALLAQEMAIGDALTQTASQAGISEEEGKKLRREHEKMTLELGMQEQAFHAAQASGEYYNDELRLQEISLQENRDRLQEVTGELQKYVDQQNAAAASTDKTAKATGQVRDFLAQASPEAAKLVKWVEKLAIESPFDVEGVKNSFLMLKSFGFMADESKRMTSALIDWASATGKTSSEMQRVSLALSQIRNLGRLAGQDVMQLAQAGIAVDRILAQSMGKTVQEVVELRTKGLIPAQDAIEAIIKQLETDWKGAAKDQAQTFSGLINSIEDIVPILTRNFFGPMDEATGKIGGIFGAVQPHIAGFVDFLSSNATLEKVKEFGVRAGAWITDLIESKIPKLKNFAGRVQETFQGISNRVMPFIDGVKDSVRGLFLLLSGKGIGTGDSKGFDGLFKTVQSNLPKIQQTAKVAFDTMKIVSGELANFWEVHLVPAVQAVSGLFRFDVAAASKIVHTSLESVQKIGAKVSEVVVLHIVPALTKAVDFVRSNFPLWKTTVEDAFNSSVKAAQPLITAVESLWREFEKNLPQIRDIITNTGETIQTVWRNVTKSLVGDTELNLTTLVAIIGGELNKLRDWWAIHGEAVLIIVEKSLKLLITFAGHFMITFRSTVSAVLLLLKGDWRGALDEIQGGNERAGSLIKQTWAREMSILRDIIDNSWRNIKLAISLKLSEIITASKNFLYTIYNSVRNRFLETLYAAQDIWNRIKGAIVAAWKDVAFDVKSIYYNLENTLKLAWSRFSSDVRRVWDDVKQSIIERWQAVYEKIMFYVNLVINLVTDPQKRQEFLDAAGSWVRAIIDTIRNKSGELYNAVVQMAQKAVQGLYTVFRIGSPSKLGQDIADNLVGSISDRIVNNIPRIQAAIGAMSNAVNVPLGGSVNHATTNNVSQVSNYNLNMTTTMPPHAVAQDFALMRSINAA